MFLSTFWMYCILPCSHLLSSTWLSLTLYFGGCLKTQSTPLLTACLSYYRILCIVDNCFVVYTMAIITADHVAALISRRMYDQFRPVRRTAFSILVHCFEKHRRREGQRSKSWGQGIGVDRSVFAVRHLQTNSQVLVDDTSRVCVSESVKHQLIDTVVSGHAVSWTWAVSVTSTRVFATRRSEPWKSEFDAIC